VNPNTELNTFVKFKTGKIKMSSITVVYNAALSLEGTPSPENGKVWFKTGKNCHCSKPKEGELIWWFSCDDDTLLVSEDRIISVEFSGKNEDDEEDEKEPVEVKTIQPKTMRPGRKTNFN
jgi:hypothetical protein